MSTINRTLSIASQRALDVFLAKITPFNAFSRNYSAEAVAKGSAVQVPLISAITATTFNSTYTESGGTLNTVTVTMSNHRIATVDITDVQMLNTDVLVENFAPQLGSALAKIIQTDVWGLVLTTNYGNATLTTSSTVYTKTQVRQLRTALAKNNVDTSQCSFVCNEDIMDALLADTNIIQAFQYGGSEAIREGKIPRLLGVNVFPTNIMPTNSITLYGFMAHPDAIAIACRAFAPVVPDGAYEDFQTVADPSGITLNSRLLYNASTGKRHWSMECLMGYSVGVSKGLVIAAGPDSV